MNQINEEEEEEENENNQEEPASKVDTYLPALQNKQTPANHKYFCPALKFSTNRRVEVRWDNLKYLLTGPTASSSKITTPVITARITPDMNSGAAKCKNYLYNLFIKKPCKTIFTLKGLTNP